MAISVPSILKERKYPFAFAFFLLLIFVTFLLISNSQSPPIPIATNLDQPDPFSPISNTTSASSETPLSNTSGNATTADDESQVVGVEWGLCKVPGAVDYIPCLDNWSAIKALPSRKRMEHRERHCPDPAPRCLVPLPQGYKAPVPWPKSRDMIWYNNVPHPKLVEYKKDQRWVVKSDDYFVFPGGGTQFKHGVKSYIENGEGNDGEAGEGRERES